MRLEQGQLVNERYRLVTRIGSGGMADVWSADDTMLHRRVALKFLHDRFAQDQQFVERFRREASSAGGLSHPNVVGVYDRGEWEGRHFIAMEYVQGASLRDLIDRGLSVPEAVEIVRQVLAGASFAHGRGIVHRDLKPGNVMVDSDGRARVTDFGIARAGASEITQTGSVMGTAHYLSPEQAQGMDVTASSDLYSIGVILYEALTGRVPFGGDSAVTIALKQVSEQPQPPSRLNPSVSRALDAVVLRALAKDPSNRFPSAAEFSRALDAAERDPSAVGDATAVYAPVAAGAGVAAAAEAAMAAEREGAEEERKGGWMNRRRALIIGALILALVAVAAWALSRPEQVTVPLVIDETRDEAERILDRRGFEVDALLRPSCSPAGIVAEQDPSAGTDVDEGSTVRLTVSTGQQVEVPELAGLTVSRARERLQDEQLLVRTKERFHAKARRGSVIDTRPQAGTDVECSSSVTLLVSKGANLVTLPDVIGLQQELAESELRSLGFIPNVETRNEDAPEGEVVGQDPGSGSRLLKGEQVTIVVSTGAGSVVMPDVEGQAEETAVSNLTSRGLSVDVVERITTRRSQDGRVISQAPGAGTRLRQGDSVTIYVGVFEEPEPPPEEPPEDETQTPRAGRR
jgi:eukaryotic-like serine/threonine-protein kinase